MWIPGKTDFKLEPKTGANTNTINSPQWIYELIDSDTMTWKTQMLEEFFEDSTKRIIQTIQLPISSRLDLLKWTTRASGELIAKEADLLDQQHKAPRNRHLLASQWKAFWRARIQESFKLLLWKMVWNVLPTNEVIGQRLCIGLPLYYLCHQQEEIWSTCCFNAHSLELSGPISIGQFKFMH